MPAQEPEQGVRGVRYFSVGGGSDLKGVFASHGVFYDILPVITLHDGRVRECQDAIS